MTTWSKNAPQNRQVLKIVDEYRQNGLKYDHLKAEIFPYKPLHFSPGSIRLEPASKDSDLMGTISAFNCLHLGHYFSDRAEFVSSSYV